MNKLLCVVSCPLDTYSGYGARSRSFLKQLIELKGDEWEIKVVSMPWGNTPFGFLEENEEWTYLEKHIIKDPSQASQRPDIWFQITIPSEFQPIGKWNCGITAGIESTISPADWIEGINRMDLTLTSSEHSKRVFMESMFEKRNKQTNQPEGVIKIEKPIEVLGEGCDTNTYKHLPNPDVEIADLDTIKDNWCYLFVSQWVGNAPIGEDRKNIGLLIKSFYETFKNKPQKPALILKTALVNNSYSERDELIKRIHEIKKTINSTNLPKIYLLLGEFTDEEMNEIYNHPKVKAMVSLTKGEGYGRTLLEFSMSKKPIIASGWSGQLDFLNPEYTTLLDGSLTEIHPQAANKWLLKEAKWFSPKPEQIGHYLIDVFTNYKKYIPKGKQQGHYSKTNHSLDKTKETLAEHLKRIPDLAVQVPLNMPNLPKLQLPKLSK